MELIPIIKYALTMISGVTFVIVFFSYVVYKIKNSDKNQVQNETEQVINSLSHDYHQNMPVSPMLQPIKVQAQPVYIHERNMAHQKVAVKKPAQRFMVLNAQANVEQGDFFNYQPKNTFAFEHPYSNSRQSFNIYNNYSASSTERLHKFGV